MTLPQRRRAGDPRLMRLLGEPEEIATEELIDLAATINVGGERVQVEPLRDPVFTAANPAPELLRYRTLREYTQVIGREPIVADTTNRLRNRVRQFPVDVESAGDTPAQQLLGAFGEAVLSSISQQSLVSEAIMPAAWWGWRPLQVLPSPRTWSSPTGGRVSAWMPTTIVDKPPWAFSWERAPRDKRRLVFRADLLSLAARPRSGPARVRMWDPDERAVEWLTPTCGTLDDPHGLGLFSAAWKLVQVYMLVSRRYFAGVDREFGQLVVEIGPEILKGDEDALDTLITAVRSLQDVMTAANALVKLSDPGVGATTGAGTRTKDAQTFIAAGADLLDGIERKVRTLISGSTLTSETAPDGGGAYALGQVHAEGEMAYAAALAACTIDETYTALIANYIRINIDAEPDPDDLPVARSRIHQALQAANLKTFWDMGGELDQEGAGQLLGIGRLVVGTEPLKGGGSGGGALPGFGGGSLDALPGLGELEALPASSLPTLPASTRGGRALAVRALEVPTAIGEQRDEQDAIRASGAVAAGEALTPGLGVYAERILAAYVQQTDDLMQAVPEAGAWMPRPPAALLDGLHEARTRLFAAGLAYGVAALEREWPAAVQQGLVEGQPGDVIRRAIGVEPQTATRALRLRADDRRWRKGVLDGPDGSIVLAAIRSLLGTPTQAPAALLEALTLKLLEIYTAAHRVSLSLGNSGAAVVAALRRELAERIQSGRAAEELTEGVVGFEAYEAAIAEYRAQQETRAVYPFLMYVIRNINTRDNHAALEGFAVRSDSPVVPFITPPNGYNCYCRLIEVSAAQAKRLGWQGEFPRGTGPLERFRALGTWDETFPKEAYVVGLG